MSLAALSISMGQTTRPELDISGSTTASSSATATSGPATSRPVAIGAQPQVEMPPELVKASKLMDSGRLIDARATLSEALLSGKLGTAFEPKAVKILTDLADKTIFSPDVYEGDPYAAVYQFKARELLARVVERDKLNIPAAFIAKINNADPSAIRVGQSVKMITGPVHAIVDKSAFTMDLYIQSEGKPKAFLRRLTVGLGKDDGTPAGRWKVGVKLARAAWTVPPSVTGKKGTIRWGESGYPLGKEGYWISLVGTDDNTKVMKSYGIHGTDEPDSIGKAASSGCVRMRDQDIDLVYSLLVSELSTVTIRP